MATLEEIKAKAPVEIDPYVLQRELDKTKSEVFIGKNAAFMGSLMCSMDFIWDENILTAATDGTCVWWNPQFFLGLNVPTRRFVLVHELWHPARLHILRCGNRDPRLWNIACDHRINNDLKADGYKFDDIQEWICLDPKYAGWLEEDIYDDLVKNPPPPPPPGWCDDIKPGNKASQTKAVNNTVRAVNQAKAGGGAGNIPGDVEEILSKFLAPVVPWEQVLHRFMNELADEDYTWSRPNRRFRTAYLPSRYLELGRLEHLVYFEDVSGSITQADAIRFNSEVKYVWDMYQPTKMTLAQFDTRITQVIEYEEGDEINEIKIVGRGGTSLECVRDFIIEHRPTAAIIFSDLECVPMEKLPFDIPIIWVAIRNRKAIVPFGEITHIR